MVRTSHHRSIHRPSFTLIEILIVIGIITSLMALTVGATIRFLQTQAQKNTEATISKVNSALAVHWRAVIDEAQKDAIPDVAVNLAGGDVKRARVIYIKLKLMQQFPMSYMEALNNPLTADPVFVRELGSAPVVWPPGPDESSVCLLIALKHARPHGINGLDPESLGPDVVKPSVQNPGLKRLVDAWGTSLAFYRWPQLDGEIDGTGPAGAGAKRDVEDGDGTLIDPIWWSTQQRITFESQIHLLSTPDFTQPGPKAPGAPPFYSYYTNKQTTAAHAYYTVPVIVSAGPDKKFGIRPPVAPYADTNGMPALPPWPDPMQIIPPSTAPWPPLGFSTSDANDNIYSHRIRLGGGGN
jgi:competence protein ComGC